MAEIISGKTAVITGATGGMGRSIALSLAAEGVNLHLLGRERKKFESVDRELKTVSPKIHVSFCAVDLEKIDGIETACKEIKKSDPEIDILIHSAGVIVPGSYKDATATDFDMQYFVNVRAPFLITQSLLPVLKKQKGQIVFVNSSAAQQKSKANLAAYTASKYALAAIADSLRDEVNQDGVRVLSIYPGRTATRMQKEIYTAENREYYPEHLLQPDDVAQAIVSALLMPRTAEITDISIRPFRKG